MQRPNPSFSGLDRWFGSPTATAFAEAGRAALALVATFGFAVLTFLAGRGVLSGVGCLSVPLAVGGFFAALRACRLFLRGLRRAVDHWRVVRATEVGLETRNLLFSRVVAWGALRGLDRSDDGGFFLRYLDRGEERSLWIPAEVEARDELERIVGTAAPQLAGCAGFTFLILEDRAPVGLAGPVVAVALMVFLVMAGRSSRFIGLRALQVDSTPALLAPVPVVSATDTRLVLANGVTLDITDTPYVSGRFHFEYPPDAVELTYRADGTVEVYAQAEQFICGTPWARPIVIPLHVDRPRRYVRQLVATARPAAVRGAR